MKKSDLIKKVFDTKAIERAGLTASDLKLLTKDGLKAALHSLPNRK